MTAKKPPPHKKAGGEAVAVVAEKDKGGAPAVAQAAIDAEGLDAICASISDGQTMTGIAARLGVSFGSLQTWLESVPERSSRVREARRLAARMWDEKALSEIQAASDPFTLAKAKEAAHHYRWRATKIAPADFGDRQQLEHTGKDGGPIETKEIASPEARAARMAELADKLGLALTPK